MLLLSLSIFFFCHQQVHAAEQMHASLVGTAFNIIFRCKGGRLSPQATAAIRVSTTRSRLTDQRKELRKTTCLFKKGKAPWRGQGQCKTTGWWINEWPHRREPFRSSIGCWVTIRGEQLIGVLKSITSFVCARACQFVCEGWVITATVCRPLLTNPPRPQLIKVCRVVLTPPGGEDRGHRVACY